MSLDLSERLGGPRFEPEQEARFAAEVAEIDQSRLRPVLTIMALLHVGHVAGFWVPDRTALSSEVLAWRDAVLQVHAASAGGAAVLALGAWLLPPSAMRWLAPLAGGLYLLHGAAIAAADQLNTPTVTPFMAYAIVIAMLLLLEPLRAIGMYAVGLVAFVVALYVGQDDPEIRRTFLPNGPSISVASVAIAVFLYRARRRDFQQRLTIQRQQDELAAWNAALEARVEDQVREIRDHAGEVERLNAQLQVQVRDRSRELARALQRLSDADPAREGLEGAVLGGRFELFRRIGAGGMGEV